jgi:DUF1365 family protein
MPEPGLYVGTLRHRRFSPRAHAFTYPIFMALLDIDRLPALMRVSPFTAHNRFAWASFHDADHLEPGPASVRDKLRADAARAGFDLPDGRVLLLTHLRYLGYVFNPVSFYYCYDRDEGLRAVLAEVNNTYGGRDTYWLTTPCSRPESATLSFRTAKRLYVSPFIPMDVDWTFHFSRPAESLQVHMSALPASAVPLPVPVLDATMRLERRPWTSGAWLRTLLRFPLMTVSVIAAIHWQALRLYVKGVPVQPRPTPTGITGGGDASHDAPRDRRRDTHFGAPIA